MVRREFKFLEFWIYFPWRFLLTQLKGLVSHCDHKFYVQIHKILDYFQNQSFAQFFIFETNFPMALKLTFYIFLEKFFLKTFTYYKFEKFFIPFNVSFFISHHFSFYAYLECPLLNIKLIKEHHFLLYNANNQNWLMIFHFFLFFFFSHHCYKKTRWSTIVWKTFFPLYKTDRNRYGWSEFSERFIFNTALIGKLINTDDFSHSTTQEKREGLRKVHLNQLSCLKVWMILLTRENIYFSLVRVYLH